MQRRLSIINDIVSTMNTRNKYSGKLFVATNCTHIHLERGEVTYDTSSMELNPLISGMQ